MSIFYLRFRAAFAGAALCGLLAFSGCATLGTEGQPAEGKSEKAASAAATKTHEGQVSVVSIRLSSGGDRIVINTSDSVKYTVFKLNDPPRVIIDLPDVDISRVVEPMAVNNDFVSEISVQPSTEGTNIGRIIVGLRNGIDHKVRAGENMLIVSLAKNEYVPESDSSAQKSGEAATDESAADVAKPIPNAAVEPAPKMDEKPALPAKTITGISASTLGANTVVRIAMDGAPGNYNSFVLDKPSRIVVDVWGVKNSTGKGMVKLKEKHVASARLGSYPEKIRLVFDSAEKKLPPFVIVKEGTTLVVNIGPDPVAAVKPSAPVAVAAKAAEPAAIVSPTAPSGTQQGSQPAAAEAASAPIAAPVPVAAAEDGVKVTLVDFRKLNGNGRLTIVRSKKTDYTVAESPDGKSVTIDIMDATLSEEMSRTLDASKLKTPVATVSSYQESLTPNKGVRVLVKMFAKTKYEVIESNGQLSVEFAGLSEESAASAALTAESQSVASSVESTSGEEANADATGKAKVYTGKKIDIDMVDANISDIFRLMAEISNLNIIASDDVKGSVSLRLKSVPWDQAFDIILKSKDLGITKEGNVIRVAPAAKLRQEREAALAAKKAQEKLETLDIRFVPVNYAVATDLEPHVKSVLSDRGSVTSEKRTNTIIIKDVKRGIEDAVKVISKLDNPIPQVQIEARIVEAESSFTRDLGIQWGLDYKLQGDSARTNVMGSTSQSGQIAGDPNVQDATTSGDASVPNTTKTSWPVHSGATDYAVNLPSANVLGALGLIIGRQGTNPFILDLRLSAGEKAGRLKTISRPRITTLDNKEAKIEQGESIPFSTTSASGTSTIFIDANLSLTVTPHITPDGSVLMKIKASRNSIGTFRTASGAPSINKKEAATEVLVIDGETTVIGGIIVSEKNDAEAGIPYLKEIPVIGWIFKNKSILDNQKELLIFITPTIIKDRTV